MLPRYQFSETGNLSFKNNVLSTDFSIQNNSIMMAGNREFIRKSGQIRYFRPWPESWILPKFSIPGSFPNLWIPAGTTILMLQPAHPGRAQSSFTSDLKACKFLKNIIHSATFLKSVFCRSDSWFFRKIFRMKNKYHQTGWNEIHP